MLSKADNLPTASVRMPGNAWAIGIAVIVAAAMSAAYLLQIGPDLADVTTLLMTNERILNGEKLYVDVRDVNPPFSVWLYFPYAFLQHLTGINAYIWLGMGVIAWLGASLFLLNIVMRDGLTLPPQSRRMALWAIAILCLIIMPTQFAQREHFCTIAILPFFSLIGARLQTSYRPSLSLALIIGAMASTLVILKPHYATGFGLVLCWLAWHRKDVRVLFVPEAVAIAALALAYAGIIFVAYPAFLETMLPIAVDVYLLKRTDLSLLLPLVTMCVLLPLIVSVWIRSTSPKPMHTVGVFQLAAIGFLAAYFIMGKGWTYHLFPAAISVYMALALQLTLNGPANRAATRQQLYRLSGGIVFLLSALSASQGFQQQIIPERVASLTRHPSLVLVTPDISTSVPIARRLQADWTERDPCDYIGAIAAANVHLATGERRLVLEQYVTRELDHKAAHIERIRPDLIVLDSNSTQWHNLVVNDARIAPVLLNYEVIATQDHLTYLARRDLLSTTRIAN